MLCRSNPAARISGSPLLIVSISLIYSFHPASHLITLFLSRKRIPSCCPPLPDLVLPPSHLLSHSVITSILVPAPDIFYGLSPLKLFVPDWWCILFTRPSVCVLSGKCWGRYEVKMGWPRFRRPLCSTCLLYIDECRPATAKQRFWWDGVSVCKVCILRTINKNFWKALLCFFSYIMTFSAMKVMGRQLCIVYVQSTSNFISKQQEINFPL